MSSSAASTSDQDAINASVAAALASMGITSTTTTITRWEAGSMKIQSPTLLRTDNYALRCLEAHIHLQNAGVWGVVNGSDAKPTTDTHDNWSRKNNQAHVLLIQLVADEYKGIIRNHAISTEAWIVLKDRLDHKNVNSTIHPVSAVFDMIKDLSTTWNEHIAFYESRYTTITSKLSTITTTDKAWQKGLKQAFAEQRFKAHLLLRTLPSSLDSVVENLRSKSDVSYTQTRTLIIKLSSESASGSALISHTHQKKNQKDKGKKKKSSSSSNSSFHPGIPPQNKFSYCWKRNLPSKNHDHMKCFVLKKALEDMKNLNGAAKIAGSTQDDVSRGLALIAFSTPLSNINPCQQHPHFPATNSKRLGRALVSVQNTSSVVWTFDTCATHHITADFSLLIDPVPFSKEIEIGDGRVVKSTGQGKVKLDIVDGTSVIPLFLTSVLYIPNWG